METPPVRRFFLSLALFLLFLWALSHLYSLLLWVFLAFTLAGALDPLVGLFARRFPRPSAVFLAYLMVLGVMGLGFYLAAPPLILQFHHPGELLPMVLQWLQDNLALSLPDLASSLASSAHVAGDLLLRVGETVSEMVLALVLAVMIALEPHLVARVAPYLPGSGWTEVLEDTWKRMGCSSPSSPSVSSSVFWVYSWRYP